MKDLIQKILDRAHEMGVQYAEIRIEDRKINIFKIKNLNVENSTSGSEKGAYIRVLKNGAWGLASTTTIEETHLIKTMENALKMAQGISSLVRNPVRLAEVKPVEDKVYPNIEKDPRDFSPEQKIEDLMDLSKNILDFSDKINNTDIDYADIYDTRYYGNTDGTYIEQTRVYVWSRILATAKIDLLPRF